MECENVLIRLRVKILWKIIIMFPAALCVFMRCSYAQEPQVYGELQYLEFKMPESFDPITSDSGIAMRLNCMLYDPLIGVGPNNEPVPVLIKSFTSSADEKTVTLEMRENAKWHDGTPITAADVEFTINLIKNPASNANRFIKKNISLIESVNVIDPLHVVITLTRPVDDPAFILGFPILPKHMQNKMGSNGIQRNSPYSVDPAGGGSGKYMFRSAMFSGPINLTRNADYYGDKAYIERIKVGIQPLYDQIANNLLFEGIHFAIELPPRYLDFFTAAGKHYLRDYNSLAFQYIGHNFDNPILKIKDIRKAITLGSDRVNMLKMVYLNRGVILSGPYAPSDPGFNVNVQPIGYDPTAAVRLLENCGYKLIDNDGIRHNGKDRLSFNLRVIADKETTNEVAILFQGNMKAIGIDIRIEHYPRQRWQEIAQTGDFDMILGEKEYNAFAEIATIFDSNEIGSNGINYSRFRSSTIDSLLTDLFNATTAEGRKRIKWNLHEAINEEQPYTFLWSVNKTAVFRNCIRRVRIQPFDFFTYINEWWIDQEMENQK